MASVTNRRSGETEAHQKLKRLALLWAQSNGYSACAVEVTLPQCRYRADVVAYRSNGKQGDATAIFECKQALVDLRRDNGCTESTRARLDQVYRRRLTLERQLRIHYPALRVSDSLFAEFDSYNFGAIGHRGYTSVVRKQVALQNRLFDCVKFETLVRYRCANLFFLVLPDALFRQPEIPLGWGVLVERRNNPVLAQKPSWHEIQPENNARLLSRIAAAGTRMLNRQFGITFDEISETRARA